MEDYQPRFDRVKEFIRENLGADLSLERLAQVACFSPWHFHRLFSAMTGETPDDYVRRVRLEQAASILMHAPHISVSEAADRCGFSTLSLFTRNFKNHFGINPKDWKVHKNRQAWRKNRQDLEPGYPYAVQGSGKFHFEVVRREAVPVAYKIHSQGYHQGVAETFGHLGRWALAQGLLTDKTRWYGIPLDNPLVTPPDRCRLLVGVELPHRIAEVCDGIWSMELSAGLHVKADFRLREDRFPGFYKARYLWLIENGWKNADIESTFHGFIEYKTRPSSVSKNCEVWLPIVPRN